MPAISLRHPDIRCEPAEPFGRGWRDVVGRLRRSRARRHDHLITDCFGKLAGRDEMVVKGLAASLTCSPGRLVDGS
jgi:hypothetical protein